MARILPTLKVLRKVLDSRYYKEYHKESPVHRIFWSDNRQTIPNIKVNPSQITVTGRLWVVLALGDEVPQMKDVDWVETSIQETMVGFNEVQVVWHKHLPNSPDGLRNALLDINVNILAYLGHIRGAEMDDSRFCISLSSW